MFSTRQLSLVLLLMILFSGTSPDSADARAKRTIIPGPVPAELIRVIDGDTLLVSASPWPGHHITTYVRLRGIDAPELHDRCAGIRRTARSAEKALVDIVGSTSHFTLADISGDKYFGRVVARIQLDDGRDPAAELLAAGLVREYQGGRKPRTRCE